MRFFIVFLLSLQSLFAFGKTLELKGAVSKVTVYRSHALVTRQFKLPGAKGRYNIILKQLPEKIVSGTLSVKSGNQVQIFSVTYREKASPRSERQEVDKFDKEIKKTEKRIRQSNARLKVLREQLTLIKNLTRFTTASSRMEIKRGILKFDELKQLAEFGIKKYEALEESRFRLTEKIKNLYQYLYLLKRKRSKISSSYHNSQKEALIYLRQKTNRAQIVSVSYLVTGVHWKPHYNFRTKKGNKKIQLEYYASIQQLSGEDWNNVELTLSTSQPTFTSEPPKMEALEITLGYPKNLRQEDLKRKLEGFRQRRYRAQIQKNSMNDNLSKSLNTYAAQEQILEIVQQAVEISNKSSRTEGISVTYQLKQPIHLKSRKDEQLLQISSVALPAEEKYIAVPVLTNFVYREAIVRNISSHVFLPGPYNTYLNGEFVGKGKMGLISSGEEFKAGLGVEPSVRVKRELISKKEDIEGGNKVSQVHYRISISNFSNRELNLTLKDRLPYSPEEVVKVRLIKNSVPLSKQARYLEKEYKKGILRWDLKVPQKANQKEGVVVNYIFQMAHEKQKTVKGMSEQEKKRVYKELKLQKRRRRK